MNLNGCALGRSFACADLFIDIFQSGFCCRHISLREHSDPKSQYKEYRCEYVFHPASVNHLNNFLGRQIFDELLAEAGRVVHFAEGIVDTGPKKVRLGFDKLAHSDARM